MRARILVLSLLLLPAMLTLAAPTASATCVDESVNVHGAVVEVQTEVPPTRGPACTTFVHYYGTG